MTGMPANPLHEPAAAAAEQPTIVQRLELMRRRARFLLTHCGVALLIFALLSGLALLVILDYLLWFPAGLRLLLGIAWLCLAGHLVLHHVWGPLRTQLDLIYVASKVEERFSEFQDRLTSSVSFITHGTALEDPLQQELIERTERMAQSIPMEHAISPQPAVRMTVLATLPALACAIAAVANPNWVATGIQRFALPFSPLSWPKNVHIEPLTTDLTIARGESVVVSMRVTKGAGPALRSFVFTRSPEQEVQKCPMRQEGPDRYAWTLNTVTRDVKYWFEAGDDSTRQAPGTIKVVERPTVTELSLEVEAPDYCDLQQVRQIPAGQKRIDLIAGSALIIRFQSSKPLQIVDDQAPNAWVEDTQEQRAYARWSQPGAALQVTVRPTVNSTYVVRLVDRDGFTNGDNTRITVNVPQDSPPRVALLKPLEVLEVTPAATVRIEGLASDDLGITSVRLAGLRQPGEAPFGSSIDSWSQQLQSDGSVVARFEHKWQLDQLEPTIGDTLEYHLEATDNRLTEQLQPQTSRSYSMLLRIVSIDQFRTTVSDELSIIARKLRRILMQQEKMTGSTALFVDDMPDETESVIDGQLVRFSAEQQDLAATVAAVRKQVRTLAERLEDNGVTSGRESRQTELLNARLKALVEKNMQLAAVTLNDARGDMQPEQRRQQVLAANDHQRQAEQAIVELLNELAIWDDYNAVVANIREIADTQQHVSEQTAALQEKTLGMQLEDLPEQLREQLEENASQQERITSAIDRAVRELKRLRQQLERNKPSEAENLAQLEERLAAGNVQNLSRRASEAIRENRTGQAQKDQNQVERALAEAVSEVRQQQSRRLAELSKQIQEIEKLIEALLQQQRALRDVTDVTPPEKASESLPPLADQQRRLGLSSEQIAERLSEMAEAAQAAERLRLAGADMDQAAEALYKAQRDEVLTLQARAIDQLQRVLEELQQLRKNAQDLIKREKLYTAKRELLEIRKQQTLINTESQQLIDKAHNQQRLTRRDVRKAKTQANRQYALNDKLQATQEQFDETPVYLWVTERIAESMQRSESRLRELQFDNQLAQAQQRIISLLDQLISAIKQVEEFADAQFAEGSSAGGAGGAAAQGKQKPVPTVAELIVLRAMQDDINRRTRQLHDAMDSDEPSEDQLQQARELGIEQVELKDLTEELTNIARDRSQ